MTVFPWTVAFLAYAYGMAQLEMFLLPRPALFAFWVAVAVSVAAALASRRRGFVRRAGLSYEDVPETPSMGLDE